MPDKPYANPPDFAESGLLRYEPWLKLLARMQVESQFRGKFDASDIAQQAMLEAWKALPQFRGASEGERIAWLRTILARVISHEVRRYKGTGKRDIRREVSLERSLEQSSCMLASILADTGPTPSQDAANREQQLRLAEVLERLPQDHRDVIVRRNLKMQSHAEIADELGRTPAAVRMLWIRALKNLKAEMTRSTSGDDPGEQPPDSMQ